MKTNLVIVDIETTGLTVGTDRIIEVAVLPVDQHLIPLDPGRSVVVDPLYLRALENMSPHVREMHTRNGLIAALETESLPANEATKVLIEYLNRFGVQNQIPMCGSSIHFDRKFLAAQMGGFEKWFHYRNVDISSIKEIWKRWFPDEGEPPKKKEAHRALDDCYESLAELVWYRERLMGWYEIYLQHGHFDLASGIPGMHSEGA